MVIIVHREKGIGHRFQPYALRPMRFYPPRFRRTVVFVVVVFLPTARPFLPWRAPAFVVVVVCFVVALPAGRFFAVVVVVVVVRFPTTVPLARRAATVVVVRVCTTVERLRRGT